jgi:hypothetical protein
MHRPAAPSLACLAAALAALALVAPGAGAQQGFRFSNPDPVSEAEREAKEERAERIGDWLSTPCRADLRDRKIMVVIGEVQSNGFIFAEQENYGPHYRAINDRLRRLGLRTYTPEEIRRQIAQAEIDAQFRNDPDAALSAARRLGASFILRGLITTQATGNPLMRVNQVTVSMAFTLTGANGRVVSTADAYDASYAGTDVAKMALTLVNEKADEVVAKLYADYCTNSGLAPPRPARKPAPPRPPAKP